MIPSTARGRPVKNLGWLLRHWKEVESFTILPHPPCSGIADCILVANLKDVETYQTGFGCASVLKDWLDRPVFRGLPIDWQYPEPKTP